MGIVVLLLASAIAVAAPSPLTPEGLFVPAAAGTEAEVDHSLRGPESRWACPQGSRDRNPYRTGKSAVARSLWTWPGWPPRARRWRSAPDARLRLNLFDDVDLGAVIERTVETRYGYSLSGRIDGDPHGMVTLVVHGDIVAGAVHSRAGQYSIRSLNGAIHVVQHISGDFTCGVDGGPTGSTVGKTPERALAAKASDGDDGSEVDLLVLFTEAALDAEGGLRRMRASIDLAVAWANDAYDASGVNVRLRLVAAVQTDYLESRAYGNAVAANRLVDLNRAGRSGRRFHG